jgi:hypothetical protein
MEMSATEDEKAAAIAVAKTMTGADSSANVSSRFNRGGRRGRIC